MRIAYRLMGLAACAALAACGQQGKYYEQTPRQVTASLRTAKLPLYILGSTAQGSKVTQPDDHTIVMAPTDSNSSELVRFVATINADGAGSRVAVEVAPPEGRYKQRIADRMAENGMAIALLRRLAQEHVDAAIEHRSFDMTMGNPMVNAVPGMREQLEQANANGMAMQESGIDAYEKTKAGWTPDKEAGGWEPDRDAGWGPPR